MVFQYINICQVPREMLKTSAYGLGFQHLPRDLANVNAWKTMFDPYIKIQIYIMQEHYFLFPRKNVKSFCSAKASKNKLVIDFVSVVGLYKYSRTSLSMQAFEMRCYRILKNSYTDCITNEEVRKKRLSQPPEDMLTS